MQATEQQVERASPPRFQISPELSKSVVNGIIRKVIYNDSLFPRHAQLSLLPVVVVLLGS